MNHQNEVRPGESPGAPVLRATGITKRFPGVLAVDNVDFELRAGEVHTLLGENGAGKSTLASVLCGAYQPEAGAVYRNGEAVILNSPHDGLTHGIAMVHQHFRLVERFTVSENIVLGDPSIGQFLNRNEVDAAVAAVGEQFGLPIDPTAYIYDLAVGQRQRVEIVKALYRNADVLLLDEPTAVLTPTETEALFVTVRAMTKAGKSVVFISHKLGEVAEISDRVTVMRAGRVTASVEKTQLDRHELAHLMVGRSTETDAQRYASNPPGEPALVASEVSLVTGGRTVLKNIDLAVNAGEVVGVVGVSGNGQRELADVLAGLAETTRGSVTIAGVPLSHVGAKRARKLGLAFIPEERVGTGLAPSLSITENLLLTRSRPTFISLRTTRQEARELIDEFEVKAPGPNAACRVLSGGNAQKVLVARELKGDGTPPAVVIAAAPTRGLDIGAIEQVRGLLHDARERGAGVLLISEDLDEVLSMADRIVVLYDGGITLEQSRPYEDRSAIGRAMAGIA